MSFDFPGGLHSVAVDGVRWLSTKSVLSAGAIYSVRVLTQHRPSLGSFNCVPNLAVHSIERLAVHKRLRYLSAF